MAKRGQTDAKSPAAVASFVTFGDSRLMTSVDELAEGWVFEVFSEWRGKADCEAFDRHNLQPKRDGMDDVPN